MTVGGNSDSTIAPNENAMDIDLIDDAWRILVDRSEADRNCRSYTWWAKLNFEPDKTMIMVNETVFREALAKALEDNDIAEFLHFLKELDRKAAERRRRAEIEMLGYLDAEERTADW
jgi:hypothetical protein